MNLTLFKQTALILIMPLVAVLFSIFFVGQPVYAQDSPEQTCENWSGGDKPAYCAALDETNKDPVGENGIVYKATNVISYIAGFIGVFWIIIQAIKMTTSKGNAEKINESRNGIIYAVVGLAVVLVARTLIMFALGKL